MNMIITASEKNIMFQQRLCIYLYDPLWIYVLLFFSPPAQSQVAEDIVVKAKWPHYYYYYYFISIRFRSRLRSADNDDDCTTYSDRKLWSERFPRRGSQDLEHVATSSQEQ